jgi:hypothetical protein
MQTTELIDHLSGNLRPTPRGTGARRLGIGLAAGAAIALAVLWISVGLRDDLPGAMLTAPFLLKWVFTAAVSGIAFALCARMARPEGAPGRLPAGVALVALVMGVLGIAQWGAAPADERRHMWLGHSALECPWNIALLAVPLLTGILWAVRGLAPTRPRLAGFSAGLLAGAAAAAVYALHCTESTATFVATWYSAGILIPALLGSLIGPRVLRW